MAITQLLQDWQAGDRGALDRLLPLVYDELHLIASRRLAGERPGGTLQTTALLNEAYIKLIDQRRADWRNRAQFFAIAAQLMRRILLDDVRKRRADKRGGDAVTSDVAEVALAAPESSVDQVEPGPLHHLQEDRHRKRAPRRFRYSDYLLRQGDEPR